MENQKAVIIAVATQKGGVGKTTTTVNLAQALSLLGETVLVVDLDPQGNATQGLGIKLDQVTASIADLLRDKTFPEQSAIYKGPGLDLIPATPLLARMGRELVGITNGEMRLALRLRALSLRYSVILIDTPPSASTLMNSSLNAANKLIVPVDSGFYAMMGIRELLAEVEEIRAASNPGLATLGFLLTIIDQTRIADEVCQGLISNFGEEVFETKIHRNVKLKEAPAFGRTIFHHAPHSQGATDYMSLAQEVLQRLKSEHTGATSPKRDIRLSLVEGGAQ
ncbi:ParA family protein [Bdellovibrionota bacterium FG-2]